MEFQDKVLTCVDCGTEFLFTSGEQAFFYNKQFANPPKRCKACKAKRAGEWGSAPPVSRASARVETRVNCSRCGKETTVPFKPTQGRPVFCRDCFRDGQATASA
jgi:CxxC-x17-CxxC domain-containing protein